MKYDRAVNPITMKSDPEWETAPQASPAAGISSPWLIAPLPSLAARSQLKRLLGEGSQKHVYLARDVAKIAMWS